MALKDILTFSNHIKSDKLIYFSIVDLSSKGFSVAAKTPGWFLNPQHHFQKSFNAKNQDSKYL